MKHAQLNHEGGYIFVGVLFLLSLSLLISTAMLNAAATNTKTRALVKTQADYYYDAEETLNKTVAWLQAHSKSLVTAFTADNFDNNFTPGDPVVGDNEGQHFTVPTMVKMDGSNNSVMLSNNDFFGSPSFPQTTHIDTGADFDAVTEFRNADLGSANARVVLIWARESEGNYEPIFRADVVTGNNPDRGVHSFSYVYSTLVATESALGFYGEEFLTLQSPNNDCSSFQYTYANGAWSKGAPRSNCPVGSDDDINISSHVNGTAKTLLDNGIHLNPPGGEVSGGTCTGGTCHSYGLPIYSSWASYCPDNQVDMTVSANTTLSAGGCYRDIHIDNRNTLTFTDTENPYYIRTLDFRSNFAKFSVGVLPPGEKVTLYIETISNDAINGNQFYNPGSAPHQLEINYIGTRALKLNGTADLNALLVAPNVLVTVNGNFNYYGGIWAKQLDVLGKAKLYYDEAIGAQPVVRDLKFALKKASQRYR